MPSIPPPLRPVQILAVYRSRYPAGLVCTQCGRLLATTAPARLPEAERLAYVCAECRRDLAEAERVRTSKSERGRKAARGAAERRREGVTQLPAWADPVPDYVPKVEAVPGPSNIKGLHGELSDAEHGSPLFRDSRRKRGRRPADSPTRSRQARYRVRHPARASADLRRLRVVAASEPHPLTPTPA